MAFSTSTCLPACSAAMAVAACRWVGLQMSTRSMSGSASRASQSAVFLDAREVHHFARGGPKLPWMQRQSPASFFGSRLQIGGDPAAFELAGGEVMDHAHEAKTDDADPHHCCISLLYGILWISTDSTCPRNSSRFSTLSSEPFREPFRIQPTCSTYYPSRKAHRPPARPAFG